MKVGSWDVTGRAGRVQFATGELYGSDGQRTSATGSLTVDSRAEGESFEMRTRFDDGGYAAMSASMRPRRSSETGDWYTSRCTSSVVASERFNV